MVIRELKKEYPLVYKRALENQVLQGNKENENKYLISLGREGNFYWDETKEGGQFWDYINAYNFETAKKLCPHLFIKQESIYSIW